MNSLLNTLIQIAIELKREIDNNIHELNGVKINDCSTVGKVDEEIVKNYIESHSSHSTRL